MSSPRHRVQFGLKWVTASLLVSQGLRFLTTVVLARLLVPEMFGLVAMGHVTIRLLNVLREIGFGAAYIQRRDTNPEEARVATNTTFFLLFAINTSLFVLAFLLAPLFAGFFQAEGLDRVLRAMFLVFLIDALLTTPSLVLQKNLQFGKHAISEIIAGLSHALIAIPLAVMGFGVWSLVFGQLGSQSIHALVLLRMSRWVPRLEFEPQIARELFSYGKYMWAFGALSAVGAILDRSVIGRVLGAASLGVYGMAFHLCNLPATHISRIVNRIAFPALSIVQDDPQALRRAFLKALSHVSILSLPLGFGILAVAEDFVLVVLGEKWAAAVPVMQVLAFYGLSLSVSSVTGPVFMAIGKPQVLLYTSLVHHSVLVPLLLLLARYGVVGIAYSVLVPLLLSSIIAFVLIIRYLAFSTADVLGPLARSCAASLLMYIAVRALQVQLAGVQWVSLPLTLILSVAVGGLVYLAATALLNRRVLVEFSGTVREVLFAKGELL